jgi:hypothetical protein
LVLAHEQVALVIAHNAGFDRRFLERLIPGFANNAWACSINEIDWAAEGISGTKLFYLLAQYGLFHDGHRAGSDCLALLEILARPLPITGRLGLEQLLVNARCPTVRIWAEYAPFDYKDGTKLYAMMYDCDTIEQQLDISKGEQIVMSCHGRDLPWLSTIMGHYRHHPLWICKSHMGVAGSLEAGHSQPQRRTDVIISEDNPDGSSPLGPPIQRSDSRNGCRTPGIVWRS